MEFTTSNKSINSYNVVYNLQTLFPQATVEVLKFVDMISFKVIGVFTPEQIEYYVTKLDINHLDGVRTPIITNKESKVVKIGTHTLFINSVDTLAENYPYIHVSNHVTRKALEKISATLDIPYYEINNYAVLKTKKFNQLDINRMLVQALIGNEINLLKPSNWSLSAIRNSSNRALLESNVEAYVSPTLELVETIQLNELEPKKIDPPECPTCSNVDFENNLEIDEQF